MYSYPSLEKSWSKLGSVHLKFLDRLYFKVSSCVETGTIKTVAILALVHSDVWIQLKESLQEPSPANQNDPMK